MSSFVIEKVEYAKAAGAVAGIVEAHAHGISGPYIFDYTTGRKMEGKDFLVRFSECFELNALNVYEYYRPRHDDEELYTDGGNYIKEFEEYRRKGRAAAGDPQKLREMVYNLRDFFQSAIYQTAENDAYFWKVKIFFNEILVALMGILYPHKCKCWGTFEA